MRVRNAFYFLAVVLMVLSNNSGTLSKEIDVPSEPEPLRLFLLKGYTSAKSVIDDVRIEYEMTKIPVNPIPISPAVREKFKITGSVEEQFTFVEEYIQKNGKERWVVLNFGKPDPTEDVSYRAELVRTKNSPRFKVFDGQYILEYASTTKDSTTKVGRGILETSNTCFFESTTGLSRYTPVKFFGYVPSLMPDSVLSNPKVQIETKPEMIDGLLTYKVSAAFKETYKEQNYTTEMTYWLSPERSCLPVKIEVWLNDKFKSRFETKEFIELEDRRWAIKSILQRNFVTTEEELREIVNYMYTIRKIELHPEIDENVVFDTSPDSLPVGAHIVDKRSGSSYDYINYPGPPGLIKKSLPELKDFGINLSPSDVNDKSILVCFFDYEQIPSRKFMWQLKRKAQEFQAKDIVVVAIQATKIEQIKLDQWDKKFDFPFPVGMIQADEEKTRFNWGVKSLPWLILTDKQHIVTAEGFGIDELDERIKEDEIEKR